MTDNTGRQPQKKLGWYVTSISAKNFNLDDFVLFKISTGYKNMNTGRKKGVACYIHFC